MSMAEESAQRSKANVVLNPATLCRQELLTLTKLSQQDKALDGVDD